MKNLVSKNPVLRFKLGRKIVKALYGNDTKKWGVYAGIPDLVSNFEYQRLYPNDIAIGPGMFKDPNNGNVYSTRVDNADNFIVISNSNPSKTKEISLPSGLGHLVKKRDKITDVRPSLKTTVIPQLQTQTRKTTLKKDSITPSVFAGHRIGKTGGLNYNINDSDKQQLIGTGQFTESDFTNARATLQALNRYFANSGLGSVKEDNAWGDLSRAALTLALSKSKSLTPFSNETTVIRTPIIPTYTPTTPINLEVANLKLNVPQLTYDRTGIREYLRSKGLNPYSFSGALRRALRMVMNGQGTDNDKLLVKGMNIFKQGGLLLPSRNPVIRFRNRNFK